MKEKSIELNGVIVTLREEKHVYTFEFSPPVDTEMVVAIKLISLEKEDLKKLSEFIKEF